MPKSKHQKQKKRMKKRRKDKTRKQQAQSNNTLSNSRSLIKRAQKYPIHSCLINGDWAEDAKGLNRIVITRQQPDGLLVFASFMIDMLLLGVKNAYSMANVSSMELKDMLGHVYPFMTAEDCDVGLAHQMIYQSIDYAAKYEMKPHKDFRLAQQVLDPRGTYPETHDLTFGMDGKPLFISGPHDNITVILSKLERTAGPGNFDYIAGLSGFSEDE